MMDKLKEKKTETPPFIQTFQQYLDKTF